MRIVGIEADAMAYGAIIRLCAARGQAERAINLLDEMNRFEVKPTTLCFSSALKAVARSHEIGVRFERGSSRKQLRRELFAAHHGKMARQIVIMAEQAEVQMDEGFVSALMLCAGAAGDSATAKAIYLASEVRKMDHMRTIGPDSSLAMLRGEAVKLSSGGNENLQLPGNPQSLEKSASEATLSGNAFAVQTDGIDDKEGASGVLASARKSRFEIKPFGEREYGKDTRALSALLRSCGQAMASNGLGTMWEGSSNQGYLDENSLRLITTRWEPSYTQTSIPDNLSTKVGISTLRRFDENDREETPKKGAARQKFRGLYLDDDGVELIDEYASTYNQEEDDSNADDGLQFLDNSKTRQDPLSGNEKVGSDKSAPSQIARENEISKDGKMAGPASIPGKEEEDFQLFYSELREEAESYGVGSELTEEEAREIFIALQEELSEGSVQLDNGEEEQSATSQASSRIADNESLGSPADDETSPSTNHRPEDSALEAIPNQDIAAYGIPSNETTFLSTGEPKMNDLENPDSAQLARIVELQAALPGLPLSRVKQAAQAFESTLSYPSLLTLVPILRETFPERVTHGWLKRMNVRNAEFVLQRAADEGVVDINMLNSMLQVKTNSSSLGEAERFHQEEFRRYNLVSWTKIVGSLSPRILPFIAEKLIIPPSLKRKKPTSYSDRLILQMLVDNNRMARAFNFKRRIESERRRLDLPSYGSLVEYCSRHRQLGSAMILLRECIAEHGAHPSEKYLGSLRVLARQFGLERQLKLDEIIGEDPTEWLKHGERHLKREKSKKGRRDVQLAYNRAIG